MERRSSKWITFQRIVCVLIIYFCLCDCLEKDLDLQNGFCSSEGCSSKMDEDKYKEHSNIESPSSNLPSELDLNQVDFNNSKSLKDQGIEHKTVELTDDIKTLQIPILDGVEVCFLIQ